MAENPKSPFSLFNILAPAVIASCIESLNIIEASTELCNRLWSNAKYLKEGLMKLGFDTGVSETPITPCRIGDEKMTQRFSEILIREGVYAKAIVFPTVPLGTGRIRNMPTAAHTREMLDDALRAYEIAKNELGL